MKKKLLTAIMSLGLVFAVTSCGVGGKLTTNQPTTSGDTTTPGDNTPTSQTDTSTTGNDPVVHNHSWDEGYVAKYPSINEAGQKVYKCATCNETKTEAIPKVTDQTNYTLDATLMDGLTGVYTTKARLQDSKNDPTNPATIGIPTVAKQNLANYPTYESPAIIQGAAVNYETKTGPTEYTPIAGKELLAPYSYFRHKIIDEKLIDADGKETWHKKLSGFDSSYYIVRVDVSDIINGKTGYLHMKQEDNKALLVAAGMQGAVDTGIAATDASNNATPKPVLKQDGYWYNGDTKLDIQGNPHSINQAFAGTNGNWHVGGTGFVGLTGTKTAVYSIENNGAALKDTNGNYTDKPYIDVVVLSSSKIVAGADTGAANAPKADIGLSFYVDETLDYNPELQYDPASTDPNHADLIAKKFFKDENLIEANNASSYIVKASDLEIDCVTHETRDNYLEYWSLSNAIGFQDYNNHTIKLICEVPVLEALEVKSLDDTERVIKLDLNSFDIQIANHTQTNAAALTVSDNATLTLMDSSRTSGAELAIGNNASMLVKNKGTLIIESSCQLEVEYDAASISKPKTATVDDVISKITALPEPEVVTENDRAKIDEARYYYEALVDTDKPNVTNYQKLADCIAKLTPAIELINGEIVVENGGKIINNGVINIEGLEVKPSQPSATDPNIEVVRDLKSASLTILEGGTLDNNGCLSIKGTLYVLGTLNNYGNYEDLIQATDPDKGLVNYHKGIQLTWKDDVTVLKEGSETEYTVNKDVIPGTLMLGEDAKNNLSTTAKINNYGSIVLVPGIIKGAGEIENINKDNKQGKLYVCSVSEAVVPITPTQAEPQKFEERRQFSPAYDSKFDEADTITVTGANMFTATIQIIGNALFGDMTNVTEYSK